MAYKPRPNDPQSVALRRQLDDAHRSLLAVHKTLLDHEHDRYERGHGPVGTPLQFLQLVLHDRFFAPLRPLSQLIALIDEAASSREPIDPAHTAALLKQARDLLGPSETGDPFHRLYHNAIQQSPDVASAHAEWRRSASAFEQ